MEVRKKSENSIHNTSFYSCFLCPDIVIFSHHDRVTIPSDSIPLSQTTFLSCGVVPSSASVNFTTRWITPNNVTISANNTDDRFTVLEGDNVDVDGQPFIGTALIIRRLSYLDEGQYMCEGKDSSNSESEYEQDVTVLVLSGTLHGC